MTRERIIGFLIGFGVGEIVALVLAPKSQRSSAAGAGDRSKLDVRDPGHETAAQQMQRRIRDQATHPGYNGADLLTGG